MPRVFDTYEKLKTEIGRYLARNDLAERIDGFIDLFEAYARREFGTLEMQIEENITCTVADPNLTLPASCRELVNMEHTSSPKKMEKVSRSFISGSYLGVEQGRPKAYAQIDRDTLYLGPTPDAAYELRILYMASLTDLDGTNPSNWLLQYHPDCYLYGALSYAGSYITDRKKLEEYKALMGEAISRIVDDDRVRRVGAMDLVIRSPNAGP